jgi:hypothetical protein
MRPARDPEPDVVIGASVKAKRLRFDRKPSVDVELHGEVRERGRREPLETSSAGEREHLPEEVEPGVTYRDISVRWAAAASTRGRRA